MQFFIDNICSLARGALCATDVDNVMNSVGDTAAAFENTPRATAMLVMSTASIDNAVVTTSAGTTPGSAESAIAVLASTIPICIDMEDVDDKSEDIWNGVTCENDAAHREGDMGTDGVAYAEDSSTPEEDTVRDAKAPMETAAAPKTANVGGALAMFEGPSEGAQSVCKQLKRNRTVAIRWNVDMAGGGPPSSRLRSKVTKPRMPPPPSDTAVAITETSYPRRLRSHAVVVECPSTRLLQHQKNIIREVIPTNIWLQRLRGR